MRPITVVQNQLFIQFTGNSNSQILTDHKQLMTMF